MQVYDLADSVTVAAAHPITVQVISQGPGIWGSVVIGFITAGAAIGAVMLTHKFTLRRERSASEDRLQREHYFIATELVFLLEQFAESCARVAADAGDGGPQMERIAKESYPIFALADVSGDWRVLDARIMYRIREVPVLENEARRTIAGVAEYDDSINAISYFRERQYQFARLGIKALILAIRLRKKSGLPETRLADTQWSAHAVLWKVWRRERKRRAAEAAYNRT